MILIIPEGTIVIDEGAYQNRDDITEVVLPITLTTIKAHAFSGCKNLKIVYISDSVTVIEDYTFADCENLEVIYLSVNTETIGAYAFLNCKKMTSILLPSSIKTIGEGAFKNCISLESVILPEYITTIENECFEGCSSLPVLIIPGYVESIGYRSFAECSNLKEVQLTGAIQIIADEAFYNCTALMNTYIPEYVETIGINAFFNVKNIVYSGSATGSPWGALKRSFDPKRDYVSGKTVRDNLKKIEESTIEVFSSVREILKTKLEGQGKSISETMSSSSIINDIKKLETGEDIISAHDFSNITFKISDLYQNSILPSNVLMLSSSRIVYIEDGLIYFIDFDNDTLQIVNKVIYKLDELMHLENSGIPSIYKGEECIFVVPKYTDTIICIYGEGVYGDGDIRYNRILLPNEVNVTAFSVDIDNISKSHTLVMIAADYRYYRFENFMASTMYDNSLWTISIPDHYFTNFCNGAIDFVSTDRGEIFKYNSETKDFDYVIDIYNERDWQTHYENYLNDKIIYYPILSFAYNCGRWIVVCGGIDYILTSANFEETIMGGSDYLETVTDDFIEVPINKVFTVADIALNDISSDDSCIIYGFDSNYNAIAIAFMSEFSPIEEIDFGKDIKPQYCTFAIYHNRAVMLNLYDETIDGFYHMYTDMKVATYADYLYTFGPSYNPCFIPYHISYGNNRTIAFGKTASGKNYNVAISIDNHHWNIYNINPDKAINIQCLEFIDENFYAAGANNDKMVYSGNGIEWEAIQLDKSRNIISIARDHSVVNRGQITSKNLYLLDYNNAEVIIINLETKEIEKVINFASYLPGNDYYGLRVTVEDLENFNANIITVYCIVNVLYKVIIDLNTDDISVVQTNVMHSAYLLSDASSIIQRCCDKERNSFIDVNLIEGANVTGYDIANTSKYPGYDEKPCIGKFLGNILFNINDVKEYANIDTNNFILSNNLEVNTYGFPFIIILANSICISDNRLIIAHKYRNKFKNFQYMMESVPMNAYVSLSDIDIRKDIYNISNDQIDVNNKVQSSKYISSDVYPVSISKVGLPNNTAGPIYYYNGIYVSLASSTQSNTNTSFYYSYDGIEWIEGKLPTGGNWTDICYITKRWFIIRKINNDTSEVYTSEDLLNWVKIDVVLDTTIQIGFAFCQTLNIDGYNLSVFCCDYESKHISIMIDTIVVIPCTLNNAYNRITVDKKNKSIIVYNDNNNNKNIAVITLNENIDPVITETTIDKYYGIDPISFKMMEIYNDTLYYTIYDNEDTTNIYYNLYAYNLTNKTQRKINKILKGNTIKIFEIDNGLVCGIIGEYGTSKILYVSTDKPEFLFFNISPVKFTEDIIFTNGHTAIVKDEKIIISGNHIFNIDIGNDIMELYEGSFYVESGMDIVINMPFIPDHVFISLAQSDNINSKYLYCEIHREDIIELDGSFYNSVTIFDGSEGHLIYRSDNATTILDKGFSFSNNTLNDRHLNFIAIKENRYE